MNTTNKFLICLSILLASCATPTKPSEEILKPEPLVVLNCPDLQQIDSTKEINMGDLVLIIVEISSQYYLCQASALNITNQPEK